MTKNKLMSVKTETSTLKKQKLDTDIRIKDSTLIGQSNYM